jgi:hypothetical protein
MEREMSETAFEKRWSAMQEIYGKKYWPDEETVDKAVGRSAWNSAIDAAMERCRYIRDTSIKACESNTSENCRAEIQKLRSE